MTPFVRFFRDSLRRKVILAFVAGFFLIATLFSLFMLVSERESLYRDSRENASGLARSFAVSSRSWVLSNDLVGMQEIAHSFQGYPGLHYAMILSPGGRVLAHTDETKIGQYLSDLKILSLLKSSSGLIVLREDTEGIDIAVPVTVGKRIAGWAWISLDRSEILRKLYVLGLKVVVFILAVTLLVFVAVTGLGNRLGRRIDALVSVANEVKAGHYDQRVYDPAGSDDEIGRLAGSLNLMLDALAQNEASLRSTSQYTRSLIEASLDPLVTISAQGKITDVNAATELVTGRSREELIGTDFSEYFTDPEQARAGYRQVFALGKVIDYPLAIRHRDGHVSEVLYNASIYYNEAGEVQGVFAAARDISEQQRAALLSAQLAAIVESSNEAIIGKTLDGTITSWNRGAEKLYGYRAEEVIGKSITLLAPLARRDEVRNLIAKTGGGDTISNHETERVRKDGSLIQVSLTLSPIRNRAGQVSGISTIARDISAQKQIELERAENLRYFESMDRIDRAMQQAKDLEEMLSDVLGEVLDIFDCDRVGLVYPCDPDSPTWQIVMERAKPGYSTEPLRGPLPMTEVRADSMRWLLEKRGPVQFSLEDDPEKLRLEQFGIRSFMAMAVQPRFGSAWEFGIHQCTNARTWNTQEAKLFEEIARRLADGLNIMLANRDLRESEQRYRLVFENSPVSIWEEDFSAVKTLLDGLRQQGVTDLDAWFTQHPETLTQCAQATKILDVNSAAIGLHGASSKEALLAGLLDTFTPESLETFRRELVGLWNGDTQIAEDAVVRTLGGELRHVTIYFTVCPGYETTWGKLIVSLVDITERKLAEEQIRQSETKYRALIQNIQTAIVVHGPDTRILISNSQAQEILGLSAEQMQGKMSIDPDWHFFLEDGKPAALEEYPVNRVLASRLAIRNTVMGVHRPNREVDVWVLVNADPVFDMSGAIAQVIVTFVDISERKQMEAALRESEEQFRGMFEKHHAVMLLIEPDSGKIIDANQAAVGYYGYPLAKLKSMMIQDINMLSADEIAQERKRAAHEERSYFVFPHRLASGEIRTVEVHSSPITVRGKPMLFSITHDITERKQAEASLKRMNERISLATRAADLGVWDWDIPNNQLIWDDRMYALYGIRREDFAGAYEAWLQGVHPDDRERSNEEIQRALLGEREFDTEFRVLWPDGSVHFIRANSLVVRDDEGKPLRMTGVNFDITERKQAEEALRREQALLNRIMETSPVGIAVVSKEGQITFANLQAEKILGLSKEQITQRSYNAPEWHSTAIDGSPFPDEAQPFSRVMATRQPVFDVQHAIVWPDGRRVLLSINGAPLFNAQGEIEGVAFAIEDITGRRLADEMLRRNEHGLSEAQRIAHLGNWELDLVKNVLTWSDEIYRIFEIDPNKFGASYDAFLNAIHPEDRDMVNKAYTDSVKNRVPYDIVHRLRMPDGRIKYVNEKCETYYDVDGTPIRSVGTVHDITARKQAELALLEKMRHSQSLLRLSRRLEQAQNYQEIMEAARDEVRSTLGYQSLWAYLFSEDRKTAHALAAGGPQADVVMSEQGTATLNIEGDPMMEAIVAAQDIVLIEDAQTDERVNKEIVTALKIRTIVNVPIILFDRHLGSVGTGTFGEEGVRVPTEMEREYLMALASHMAAALDRIYLLNERRKAEQEVQELNRDLERRVAERTEQLEVANRELESFSYSVSHDLRSPLRAIDGFSHILLEDYTDKLDEEGRRILGIVRGNTQRMGQLIDDILQFSRTGRLELTRSNVDMEAMAHAVLAELQAQSGHAGLDVVVGHLPPAAGDTAMLRQVFVNLLSNAIKFSRTRDKPHIEVGSEVANDEVVYYVKDNGVGFDMQYAGKLFGVFQRLHGVNEFEGTGIGLAIVKRIITRHGGRVWAEGKVGEGATVYFALPVSNFPFQKEMS